MRGVTKAQFSDSYVGHWIFRSEMFASKAWTLDVVSGRVAEHNPCSGEVTTPFAESHFATTKWLELLVPGQYQKFLDEAPSFTQIVLILPKLFYSNWAIKEVWH